MELHPSAAHQVGILHRVRVVVGVCFLLGAGFLWAGREYARTSARPEAAQPSPARRPPTPIFEERFNGTHLSGRWRDDSRFGWTRYTIVPDAGSTVLRADSQSAASTLIAPVSCSAVDYPRLRWRWKVERLPAGADLSLRRGSDAAARVYVVFTIGRLLWQKRLLNYVWATSRDPNGIQLPSAFSRNSAIFVIESGDEFLNQWRTEERNIYVDYRRAFGAEPPPLAAIALMTDTDNTRSHAIAYYDDITLGP